MRTVPEWVASSDDQAIPARVKLRVFDRFSGICPKCSRKLRTGHFDYDHIVSLANGGRHAEFNLQPLCTSPCHSTKTKQDVAEKSRTYERRKSYVGLRKPKGQPMPGTKASGWKKKISGEVVRR